MMFFSEYVQGYEDKMARVKSNDQTHIGNQGEQKMMTTMLKKSELTIDWLSICDFMRGQWYSSKALRDTCPKPWVLQNNYIVGNAAKIERAKKWGYWYLSSDSQTCQS